MGCGGSTGSSDKIQLKKTKLADMDEFFDDVQGIIDEIYELKDPVEEARDALLESTGLDKVTGGNTHHAIVGIVFAIASQARGTDVDNLFTITVEEPYIEVNTDSASGNLLECIGKLGEYIKALVSCKSRIEPLSSKVKEFAQKAPELPSKAKESLGSAGGLGLMDQINAVKYTATNCKQLGSLPELVKQLGETIKASILEIKDATKELTESLGKFSTIGKKCSDKDLKSPKDCYLECGKKIMVTAEDKKKQKKKKSKKPIKSKGTAKESAKGNTKVATKGETKRDIRGETREMNTINQKSTERVLVTAKA